MSSDSPFIINNDNKNGLPPIPPVLRNNFMHDDQDGDDLLAPPRWSGYTWIPIEKARHNLLPTTHTEHAVQESREAGK